MDTGQLIVILVSVLVGTVLLFLLLWLCWYWCNRGTSYGGDREQLLDVEQGQKYGETSESNFQFYMNQKKVKPSGWTIQDMLFELEKNYAELEANHSYIQWLFPITEQGMNYEAKPLTLIEADRIKSNPEAKARLVKAYRMMLDFYGLRLVDEETGTIDRAMDAHHVNERFQNMDRRSHNFLRVTRIIKSLGLLGYEHYQTPLVRHLAAEILVNNQLSSAKNSLRDYWIPAIKNPTEREELEDYFKSF